MNLLEVDSIDVHYGDFQALYGVSVSVAAGETLAIIGANGAGKSTLMKALAGLMTPTAGSIAFEGRDVTGGTHDALDRDGLPLKRLMAGLEAANRVGERRGRIGPTILAAGGELVLRAGE